MKGQSLFQSIGFGDIFGQRIRYQIYTFMALVVLALVCIFVLPFFGLPRFQLLATAFIIMIPYVAIPTEDDIRRQLIEQRDANLAPDLRDLRRQARQIEQQIAQYRHDLQVEMSRRPQDQQAINNLNQQLQAEQGNLNNINNQLRQIREHPIVGQWQGGNFVELMRSRVGLLFLKAVLRVTVFVFTFMQFFLFNRLIALLLSFFFYFMLPGRYRTDQPYKMFEAWLRLPLGAVLAALILLTFEANPVGVGLAWMVLAFFLNFPVRQEVPGGAQGNPNDIVVTILDNTTYANLHTSFADKAMFFVFMMGALIGSFGLGGSAPVTMTGATASTFIIVWVVSLFTGWMSGPEGRPALGVMMILISMFAFASTYTGIMGQAIFGYWWPQVYGGVEAVGDIFGPVMEQATQTTGDAWLLLTNPTQYYNTMMQKQQATTTKLKTGGNIRSIELVRFDAFTATEGFIDPYNDPVIGYIELENEGEFNANRITLTIQPTWLDPKWLSKMPTGGFKRLNCSKPSQEYLSTGTCDWTNITYPSEIKLISFLIPKEQEVIDTWRVNADINAADCVECTDDKCTSKIVCPACSCAEPLYKHANEMIDISAIYNYDYNVNVSIEAEVIDFGVYEQMLAAREIRLQELTSQYTGGPVKATIWSQRQPIRAGEPSLFVFSIYNDGNGELRQIKNATIKIPSELGIVEKVSSTFRIGNEACAFESVDCSPYDNGNDCEAVDGCGWTGIAFDDPAGTCVRLSIPCDFYNNPDVCEQMPGCYWTTGATTDGCDDVSQGSGGNPSYITCKHNLFLKRGEFVRVSFFVTPASDITVEKITSLIIGLAEYEYEKEESKTLTITNNPLH